MNEPQTHSSFSVYCQNIVLLQLLPSSILCRRGGLWVKRTGREKRQTSPSAGRCCLTSCRTFQYFVLSVRLFRFFTFKTCYKLLEDMFKAHKTYTYFIMQHTHLKLKHALVGGAQGHQMLHTFNKSKEIWIHFCWLYTRFSLCTVIYRPIVMQKLGMTQDSNQGYSTKICKGGGTSPQALTVRHYGWMDWVHACFFVHLFLPVVKNLLNKPCPQFDNHSRESKLSKSTKKKKTYSMKCL